MTDPLNPPSDAAQEGPILVAAELVEEPVRQRPGYWGFWATIGLSAVVAGAYFAVQTAVVIAFMIAAAISNPSFNAQTVGESLGSNGLLLGIGSLIVAPPVLGLIWLFIHLRRGVSVAEYLDLRGVRWQTWCVWLAAMMAMIVGGDTLTFLAGRDIVPPFMTDAWQTAGWLPLLWIAVIFCSPLIEETFFRGFFFVGLWRSPLGGIGAVVITSLAWACIHTQYDFFQVTSIFFNGILLGVARIRSRSLYVPMAMHALTNLVATAEAAWVMMQR